MEGMFVGMEATGEYRAILARHGFDQGSFTAVHHNAIYSYGAMKLDQQKADIEASQARSAAALEKMKGQLSAEQLEMMKQTTAQAGAMLDAYKDVPAANIDLLRRREKEFDAAFGK
jgi:hypothetical protein